MKVLADNKKVLSGDDNNKLMLWDADTGVILSSCSGPTQMIDITLDRRFAVTGNRENR